MEKSSTLHENGQNDNAPQPSKGFFGNTNGSGSKSTSLKERHFHKLSLLELIHWILQMGCLHEIPRIQKTVCHPASSQVSLAQLELLWYGWEKGPWIRIHRKSWACRLSISSIVQAKQICPEDLEKRYHTKMPLNTLFCCKQTNLHGGSGARY